MRYADPELADKDIGTFALFAFRYALYRRTSAPSDVADAIRAKWDSIPLAERTLIAMELEHELASGVDMMKQDRDTWKSLLEWMEGK